MWGPSVIWSGVSADTLLGNTSQISWFLEVYDKIIQYVVMDPLQNTANDAQRGKKNKEIGLLHDDVILLLRPESFSFFLVYFNLVIPARFR